MGKTPYEIRYELLMMAQSILNEKVMNERIKIENNWNMQCDAARVSADLTHMTPSFPAFPNIPVITEEDIIQTANKLNEFVSKTGE